MEELNNMINRSSHGHIQGGAKVGLQLYEK